MLRGDWIRVHCGDKVTDGSRAGRVEAVLHGAWVVVKWSDGEKTELPLDLVHEAMGI